MRLSRLLAGLVFTVAPIGIATSLHSANAAERAEIARIRAHFDSVLTELRDRDVSSLTAGQRANRQSLMVTLAAYRDRDVFPHNYDFTNATPYFIDRKTGTLCAVAHLLESTGRRDIVDRVARMNNVWVAELKGDTALAAWLDRNGLTLAEAARIQVPYVRDEPMTPAKIARNTMFFAVVPTAAAVAATTTVWNIVGNSDGHRSGVSWSGVAAGGVTSAAGALLIIKGHYEYDDSQIRIGAAAATLGTLSILTSSRTIYRHRVIAEREAEQKKRVAEATMSPLVGFDRANPSFGASLSVRF